MTDTFLIGLYRQGVRNAPINMTMTWDQLVEMLSYARFGACDLASCQGARCVSKEGPCWSPTLLAAGDADPGRRRVAAQFSLLVLDIDHRTEAETLGLREALLRYRHMIHATHSDRPGDRCMRVVIPLSRPVTFLEESALRTALEAWGPFQASDRMSNNGRRVHYVASRPRGADFFIEVHGGETLDVDAVLATAQAPITVPSTMEMQA